MPSHGAGTLHVRPDNIVAWREEGGYTALWRQGIATPDKVAVTSGELEEAVHGRTI